MEITKIFHLHEARYGHRRVHQILGRRGRECGVGLVRELMGEAGLRAAAPRKWQVTTRPDKQAAATVPDLVRRDFTASAPGAKLVGDITYVLSLISTRTVATRFDKLAVRYETIVHVASINIWLRDLERHT